MNGRQQHQVTESEAFYQGNYEDSPYQIHVKTITYKTVTRGYGGNSGYVQGNGGNYAYGQGYGGNYGYGQGYGGNYGYGQGYGGNSGYGQGYGGNYGIGQGYSGNYGYGQGYGGVYNGFSGGTGAYAGPVGVYGSSGTGAYAGTAGAYSNAAGVNGNGFNSGPSQNIDYFTFLQQYYGPEVAQQAYSNSINGVGATSYGYYGPQGGYGSTNVYPANSGVIERTGGGNTVNTNSPPGYFGVSSSSQSAQSDVNGQRTGYKSSSVLVNDNGKVTTYTAHGP